VKVKLTSLASFKLTELLDYLEEEWSLSTKNKFLKKLESKVGVIKSNPDSFIISDVKKGLRRCVVTKQTTLLYKYDSETIYIITVFDNRQDLKSIEEEINKHFG